MLLIRLEQIPGRPVNLVRRDEELLLTFFDFPIEHWQHLRTTNVIESPFATVRLRQRVTKGAGSRRKALMMAFKLLEMAQRRWRRINGSELAPLVRAGVEFVDGVQVERTEEAKDAARPRPLSTTLADSSRGLGLEKATPVFPFPETGRTVQVELPD